MKWLRTFLLHAAIVTAVFSPVLLRGQLLAPDDGLHFFLPAYLANERIWDPYLMCGFPAFADPQTMLWYPLRHLPGGVAGWNSFILSGFTLAAAFFHRWVASLTKSELGGFIAGFAYALSGYLMSHLRHPNVVHTAAWIPFVFFAIDRIRETPTRRRIAALAAAIAMTILAGHPQTLAYLGGAAIAYAARESATAPRRRGRILGATALSMVLACALAAILVVPMLDLSARSFRAVGGVEDALVPKFAAKELTYSLVSPIFRGGASSREAQGILTDAFVGFTGFALALFALLKGGRRERFLGFLALAGVILALGDANSLHKLGIEIPGFDMFRVSSRHLAISHLAISALAGFGISRLPKTPARIAAALVVLEVAGFAFSSEWRFRSLPPHELDAPAFLEPVREELGRTGQRLVSASGRWQGKDGGPPNRTTLWKIPTCAGYNPLRTQDITQLLDLNLRAQVALDHLIGEHRALDLAAVRYLTVDSKSRQLPLFMASGRWTHIASHEETLLFESRHAMPRAWLTPSVRVMHRTQILKAVHQGPLPDNSTFDPSRTALVEEPISAWNEVEPILSSDSVDSLELVLEGARISRIRTYSAAPRFLVLSDAYDAGWGARVDGNHAPIHRCDFMFMGIALPPGEHEVRLDYRPRRLLVGAAITIVAVSVLLGLLIWRRIE